MDKVQKNKIANFVLIFVYLALAIAVGYLLIENENLQTRVEKQKVLLETFNISDSTLISEANRIKSDIKNITSSFTYINNGKKLTGDALVSFIDKIENERDSIKMIYDYASKIYGFKIKHTAEKRLGKVTWTVGAVHGTRADSADITYYFYKDRIYKRNGEWSADMTSKKDLDVLEKAIREKIIPESKEILKIVTDTNRRKQP